MLTKVTYTMLKGASDIVAEIAALGSSVGSVYVTTPLTLTANLTVPANVFLVIVAGGTITTTGYSLTINGPFEAGNYQVFVGTGAVTFGKGYFVTASPSWWGLSPSASAATNSTALKEAIDSLAPKIQIPSGLYSYDTSLEIRRAVTFQGAGGVDAATSLAVDTDVITKLTYTGNDVAIKLIGVNADSTENIYLRDFELYGTASAIGGIQMGTPGVPQTIVTKGAFKNVKIAYFNKVNSGGGTGGFGIRCSFVLEWLFENCYANFCYDGFVSYTGDIATTLRFINCCTLRNFHYGVHLLGTFQGCQFMGHVAESNEYAGLVIGTFTVRHCEFIGWWSEDNNRTGGDAPIEIGLTTGSSVPTQLSFIGGVISNPVNNVAVDIRQGRSIIFSNVAGLAISLAQSPTSDSVSNCYVFGEATVANNRISAVCVNNQWSEIIPSNSVSQMGICGVGLDTPDGIININSNNTDTWYAIFGLKTTTGNVTLKFDPDTKYQTSAPADSSGKIGVFLTNSIFKIKNATADELTFTITR